MQYYGIFDVNMIYFFFVTDERFFFPQNLKHVFPVYYLR